MMSRVTLRVAFGAALVLAGGRFALAEAVTFKTSDESSTPYRVSTRVKATGKPILSAGRGKTAPHVMTARAEFAFTERRLPSGGRDALSLRAARDFELARMESVVTPEGEAAPNIPKAETTVILPQHLQFIVAEGRTSGVDCYCPTSPMTRETIDLLELPGDPLALTALLPPKSVDVDESWSPPEWAGQMLAAIEAIEKSTLTCRLASATDSTATISISGSVKGQRDGANCEVTLQGTINYDRAKDAVSQAKLTYSVKSSIGAVSPGLDLVMEVETHRQTLEAPGRLSDKVLAAIPITAPAGAFDLVYDAGPWGIRLRHSREWFFYQATLEHSPQVAIFRLMDKGSIIAQCNMSPIAGATAGQHVPLDQFENDIKTSLGARLDSIRAKEQLNVDTGMKVFRVIADGKHTIAGPKEKVVIPTTWIYYLCAAPSGKQASFVFAVESKLVDQMGSRDEELVRSLQFTAQRAADAKTTQ
ncbi:hypothetical protein Pan44_40870 [Caulifigura coniformis]|uniref:Uncharacterized protein n=1 Tax=Caulifigura coniformis TaxID=2527983 RepID=A0A517SIT8_9PLAN|nr:hypothetical protein [Caulifigura coniformis]QDT56037.1 hypothetical protein Pan44_40870 [Caulifigura coniformis]